MTLSPEAKRARQLLAELARKMITGELSFIEGAREIVLLRGIAKFPDDDPDILPFRVIDSDTEIFPFGRARELWQKATLDRLQPEIDRAEEWARQDGTSACQNLIRRLGDQGSRVHMIWDYFDGPLRGIADFQAKPHIYRRQFDEAEDSWTDLFWLMEIDEPLFKLAKEQHEIFLRWRAEFKNSWGSIGHQRALSADQVRDSELTASIGDRLELRQAQSITMRAHFRPREAPDGLLVEWTCP